MSQNLGQLRTLALSWLDDPNGEYFTTAQMNVFLNNAQRELQKRLIDKGENYYVIRMTGTMVVGEDTYTLPTDFKKNHKSMKIGLLSPTELKYIIAKTDKKPITGLSTRQIETALKTKVEMLPAIMESAINDMLTLEEYANMNGLEYAYLDIANGKLEKLKASEWFLFPNMLSLVWKHLLYSDASDELLNSILDELKSTIPDRAKIRKNWIETIEKMKRRVHVVDDVTRIKISSTLKAGYKSGRITNKNSLTKEANKKRVATRIERDGYKHIEATKNKISEHSKGKKVHTTERKLYLKNRWKKEGNPNYKEIDKIKLLELVDSKLLVKDIANYFSVKPTTILEKFKLYYGTTIEKYRGKLKGVKRGHYNVQRRG